MNDSGNDSPWDTKKVRTFYELPFIELIFKSHSIHRQYFNANEIELCTLLSIKTGSCPEDCGYCPQSAHFKTSLQKEKLLAIDQVIEKAKTAKAYGATRFCMGAAWKYPPKKEWDKVLQMIKEIKALGLETCVTLGQLSEIQTKELKQAGLDFYNHNLDTSRQYYKKIITTRTFEERLDTLELVRAADIQICSGGIIGMGESREDRIELLIELASLPTPPKSVPINRLMPVKGTPLGDTPCIDDFEFIRTIAVARIMLPHSFIRLSAGRDEMSFAMQAFCFMAGANSIFSGSDKLLTTPNPSKESDMQLLKELGLTIKKLKKHDQSSYV